jgi:mono/diheme cytochrome c family protein
MKRLIVALFALALTPFPASAQSSAPDPAAGKALWDGNNTQCKNCHGKNGEGAFGPDLAGRGLSAAQFQQAVRKPWGVMPTFIDSQVSDAELANMTAYFAGLPKSAEPGPWRFPVPADAPHGQQVLLAAGCAQCHGPTFDGPRGGLGGTQADFALFKDLVYNHTTALPQFESSLGNSPPPDSGRGNRPPPRIHMGNYAPLRLPESQLQEIYDWARDDIGFRPLLQGRLTAGAMGPDGATYTLNLANNGLKGKGLVAQGLTIDLVIPAGTTVQGATGDGYKGVHMDAQAKGNVAEWQVARLSPKDARSFTITLSKPGTEKDNLKGSIRWTRPAPKSGPNLDVVNIAPAPLAP